MGVVLKRWILGAGVSLLANVCFAEAVPPVAAMGDAERGAKVAAQCVACHGPQGVSVVPNFPMLAGQGEKYLVKQLRDMKSGARNVPEMAAIMPGLTEQDWLDLSRYFAQQTAPAPVPVPAELVDAGRRLYHAGDAEHGIAACAGCHGAAGEGIPAAGFPRLAGQHAAYIAAQLQNYRAAGRGDEAGKKRDNDGDAKIMRTTAAKLSDAQIKAVSAYVSGLYQAEVKPAQASK
jgi:cytochrome c553